MSQNKTEETDDRGFEIWFQNYLLHKTASCADRDILRWAKPVLKVGFLMQERDWEDDLEYKGAGKYLTAYLAQEKLLDIADLAKCLADQCIASAEADGRKITTVIEKNIVEKYNALLAEHEELKEKMKIRVVGDMKGMIRKPEVV